MVTLYYLKQTNIQIKYGVHVNFILTLVGAALLFDDDQLIGLKEMVSCPTILFVFIFQVLILSTKSFLTDVVWHLIMQDNSKLL